MKITLLLIALLLLTGTAYADVPSHKYTQRFFARFTRKAERRNRVAPHKVRHAYNRNRGLKSLITF